jgi:hypothetical protein
MDPSTPEDLRLRELTLGTSHPLFPPSFNPIDLLILPFKKPVKMVSKTATLILFLHTTVSLLTSLTIQSFANAQPISIPWGQSFLFYAQIHAVTTLLTFFFTSLLKFCLSRKGRRMSIKRHVFTAIILAPFLAQVVGRSKGWLVNEDKDPIVWTAACYDQLDAQDPNVLVKAAFCGLRHGKTRSRVEKLIGRRRERFGYVEVLAMVCQEGLRDMEHSIGLDGVCWIGKVEDDDEWMEGEASQREWFRRGFEECHARFGVDAQLEWRGEVCCSLLLYTPAYGKWEGNDTDT